METEEYKGIQNIKKLFENSNSSTNNTIKEEDGDIQLSFRDLKSKFETSSPNSSSSNSYIEAKLKSPPLNQANQTKSSTKVLSSSTTPSFKSTTLSADKTSPNSSKFPTVSNLKSPTLPNTNSNQKPPNFSTEINIKTPTLSATKSDTNSNTISKKGTPPQVPNKPILKSKPPPIPTNKPDLDLLKPQFHSRSPSIRKSQSPVSEVEVKEDSENEYSFIKSQLKSPSFRKSPSPIGDEKSLKTEFNNSSSNGSSPLFKRSPGLRPIQRAVTLNESQRLNKSPINEKFNFNDEPPKLPQRRAESIQVEEPEQLDHLFTELKNPFSPGTNSDKSTSATASPPRLPPRGNSLPMQPNIKLLTPLQSPQPKLIDIWYDKIPHKNKIRYEKLFNELDTELEGFIWGPEARNIMIRSRLDCDSLANIWDLVDMNRDGQLDKKEFCIMVYLIDRRLEGYETPSNL
ncbi:hypothetical protein CONCODRAFT_82580 [Conidiobolus coronatus NRRL 28638]|uniref:EF-hand n=1 Tax=Conidiobolus coronatus (strain ATCC 28846 / CBS 209.66 / NRRL 28638) TaxID=796925 RepID=A0A137PJ68_CONC2|nr:hypothetical protein CONCODRAFT_82580 [Conidiobolus coronatus NRRL 28638]|eukprot:KXN75046.1 hypothetical protein CONCODRAFT_82580 [Conidiobolus coronatus NRRL 28638]